MKVGKRILIALLCVLALFTVALGIAAYVLVTPQRLTPIVLDVANKYLDAKVQFEEVDVAFFSTFPQMGVRLKAGQLIRVVDTVSACPVSLQDTLLRFSACVVSFSPLEFLFRNKLLVQEIRLEQPVVYASTAMDGHFNWDILPPGDTTGSVAVKDTTSFLWPELRIKQFEIVNGTLIYDDFPSSVSIALNQLNLELSANLKKGRMRTQITDAVVTYIDRREGVSLTLDQLNLRLSGSMKKDSSKAKFELDMRVAEMWNKGTLLAERLPVHFSSELTYADSPFQLSVKQALLAVAGVDFTVDGTVYKDDTLSRAWQIDANYKLHASSMSDLLATVPKAMSDLSSKILVEGEILMRGTVYGFWGDNNYPVLKTDLHLLNGRVRTAGQPDRSGIEKVELEGEAYIDLSNRTPSYIRFERIALQSASSSITVSGEAEDIFTTPLIRTAINGTVNFTRLAKDLSLTDSMDMRGRIRLDMAGAFFLNDIITGNHGKIKLNGEVDVDSVYLNYPAQQLAVAAPRLRARFGANLKDSIRGRERDILFRGNITSDSLKLGWNGMDVNAGSLSVVFSTSPPKDTLAIAPVFSNIRTENVRLVMEGMRLRAKKLSGMLRLAPLATDPSKPEYIVRLTLDTLRGRIPDFGGNIGTCKINARVKQRITTTTRRRAGMRTSDTTRTERQRNWRNSPAASLLNIRLESEEARTALRNWELSGNMEIKSVRVRTPFFPLRIQVSEGIMDLSTDSIKIKSLQLQAGRSALNVSGDVKGIRRALLFNGRVTVGLDMTADTVDVNELVRAMVTGSNYTEKDQRAKDAIAGLILDDTKEIAALEDTTVTGVFVVPRNVDFNLQAKIRKAYYSKMELDDVNTQIIVRNQAVQFPQLKVHSTIGDVDLSLVYRAADTRGAHVGLDVTLHQIQLKELIAAFPVFDSLTPMLRSFEGVVDCQVTAVTNLDKEMNVDFSTASASLKLAGKNMVLLDGETFAEIAKMLYFKNKRRNIIDNIAVELILRDNYLLIFPFLLDIDRYEVAVGGTQYLDKSFDYHVSVLKWPIPLIKPGINITGHPDKFKIRLAKRIYKDLNDPVKKQSMFGQLFNVKDELENRLKENIKAIIDQPPVTPLRTSRSSVATDSLRLLHRRYFSSDTTNVDGAMQEDAALMYYPVIPDTP